MKLGIKPTVDFAFKKIFGSPENVRILMGLLNAILNLPRPIVDVAILNPFSYKEFDEDKQIVLDVRARDAEGRWLNIEMQLSIFPGFLERLTYYACRLYVDQLAAGQSYRDMTPAISICLLGNVLFPEATAPHHRFRLCDPAHGRELSAAIEVHTVELTKYNFSESTIDRASELERWVYFLLFADRYDPARLRELLPGVDFQQAISVIQQIAEKTEDRAMYDQREKAQRDRLWELDGAREEGLRAGIELGIEKGMEQGIEKGMEQGIEKGMEQGIEKGMEQGIEKGMEQGIEMGLIVGKIQALQQILDDEPTPLTQLRNLSSDERSRLLGDLQRRIRSRR